MRARARVFRAPCGPTWPDDALTRAAFRRRLARYTEDWSRDQGYSFFLCRRDDDALLGGITLANVRRGVAQSCTFCYWVGNPFARHGYMTAAFKDASCFAFDLLRLPRVDAATLPPTL